MAQKVIAIEIGHWFYPSDRYYPDSYGEWWECKFNFMVGFEIKNQLERHGYKIILNDKDGIVKDIESFNEKFNDAYKEYGPYKMPKEVLGGMPAARPENYVYYGVVFSELLAQRINSGEIELLASVSIHFNGSGTHDIDGFETQRFTKYKDNDSNKDNAVKSDAMCQCIEDEIRGLVSWIRPRKESEFAMCKLPCPSVYCECGFYDNPEDRKYFDTEVKQKQYGVAIAKGILRHLGVTWKPYIEYQHYRKEFLSYEIPRGNIPNNSLLVIPGSVTYDLSQKYPDARRVSNGNLYYYGDIITEPKNIGFHICMVATGADVYSDKYFPDYPVNGLIVVFGGLPNKYGLRTICNGNTFYKIGGVNNPECVYGFEKDPPSLKEYQSIPSGSLYVVYGSEDYKRKNLRRVANGNIYIKM